MTNNDELETLIKGLSKAITAQGKVIDKMALRIDTLFEIKEIKENEQKPEPKKEEPKPEKDAVKGTRIEYKFEEYINREGECKSYVIYHPDSEQMVKYIAKSLIFEGGPDEDGNLYVKKGSSWVLEKEWVVKKA